jgi:hypothetical protein
MRGTETKGQKCSIAATLRRTSADGAKWGAEVTRRSEPNTYRIISMLIAFAGITETMKSLRFFKFSLGLSLLYRLSGSFEDCLKVAFSEGFFGLLSFLVSFCFIQTRSMSNCVETSTGWYKLQEHLSPIDLDFF